MSKLAEVLDHSEIIRVPDLVDRNSIPLYLGFKELPYGGYPTVVLKYEDGSCLDSSYLISFETRGISLHTGVNNTVLWDAIARADRRLRIIE